MSNTSSAMALALVVVALATTACDRRADPAPGPVAASPPAATGAVPTPVAPPPIDPLARPVGADEVDLALTNARAFTARAAAELTGIARSEARIKALAARVVASVASGGAMPDSQRRSLSASIQAARTETETLRDSLSTAAVAFRLASAAEVQAMETALAQCATNAELAALPACASLPAEQAAMAQSVAALGRRYDAAEATWRQERTRLEEASAIVALGSDGAGLR